MKRCGSVVIILAVLAMARAAGVAWADRPVKEPSPDVDLTFSAATGNPICAFPVTWKSVANKGFTNTHFDRGGNVRWLFGAGNLVVRVTNEASGKSEDLNVTGPGNVTYDENFTGATLEGRGHFLVSFLPTDSPGFRQLLFSGHIILHIDFITGQLRLVSATGTLRDICAELSQATRGVRRPPHARPPANRHTPATESARIGDRPRVCQLCADCVAGVVEAYASACWRIATPESRAFRRSTAFVCSWETRDSVTPSTSPISRSVSSS